MAYQFTALVHEDESGGYWAEVQALPGCVTEGETLDEITSNLREAIWGWLEIDAKRKHKSIPAEVSAFDTPLHALEFATA